MPKTSAGLLLFRHTKTGTQVLLVHPGGPFWKSKDDASWTIPKGEVDENEELLACAKREFTEETSLTPTGPFHSLGSIKQKSGKTVYAWAFEGDCDPTTIVSNTIHIEWPPKSGKQIEIPEVDRADFFDIETAKQKINPAQIPFLECLPTPEKPAL